MLGLSLPIGISFFTFQTMSYTIDVYYKKIVPEKSLLKFATFVAFFPQLVAGPIIRASCFLPQLQEDRKITHTTFINGMHLIIWGFFLKVVLADSLSLTVDNQFAMPETQSSISMLFGIIFYSFQIYGDFAGYSLIAIGIAKSLGFHFPQNFNRPYIASSLSDFWKRWHISLSSWLRDYLYIPLGGNRDGRAKTYRNLMITMLLGGLWHGASWNFVIWGGIHGAALIVNHQWNKCRIKKKMNNFNDSFFIKMLTPFSILSTFFIVTLAWVFFRASDINDAMLIISKALDFTSYSFSGLTNKFYVAKGIALITFVLMVEITSMNTFIKKAYENNEYLAITCSALVLLLIFLLGSFGNNSFIYFQF